MSSSVPICALGFISFFFIFEKLSHAQPVQADTTREVQPRFLQMGFERNVNTFLWDFKGGYSFEDETWKTSASERFQRMLIKTERQNIKDEQSFRADASRRILPGVSAVASFSSFMFTDNRTLGLYDISNNKILGGFQWIPFPELLVKPLAGYSFDNQQGILDRGFIYSGEALLRNLQFGDYRTSAEAYLSADYLSPRYQQEKRAAGEFHWSLGQSGSNRTTASYRNMKRDLYLPADSTIMQLYGIEHPFESREERIYQAANQLQYEFVGNVFLIGAIDVSQREIVKSQKYRNPGAAIPFFDTNIEEFRLNANGAIRYRDSRGTNGDLRIELNERNETHSIQKFEGANPITFARQERLEQQKNNFITQTQIALNLSHPVTPSDTISFSGSSVKLEYNTPSEANLDDRDELFLLAGIHWIHRFSPYLTAAIAGDVNLRHTVYIHSDRSANNTWNRVFRICPSTELRINRNFASKIAAEVIANYTVYDFEKLNPSLQSFSLRQMTLSDSTTVFLGHSLWLSAQLQLRVYERGELRWETFKMRPLAYIDERSIAFFFIHRKERFTAAAGFRMFQQTRYSYQMGEKKEDNVLRSYGPVCQAQFALAPGTLLVLDGWYQITTEQTAASRITPNISLNLLWNL